MSIDKARMIAEVCFKVRSPDTYSHTLRVAGSIIARELEIQVAYLHDVLEDCGDLVDEDTLYRYFDRNVVEAVKLLTRSDEDSYWEYIHKLEEAPGTPGMFARRVKRADAEDNLNRSIGQKSRQARYQRVLDTITNTGLAK